MLVVHMHTEGRAGRRAFAEFPVSEELGTGERLEATPAYLTYSFIYILQTYLPTLIRSRAIRTGGEGE